MAPLSHFFMSRLKIVRIGIIGALASIILYLFHLQINLVLNFFNLGQQNFLRYEKVTSLRGNIIDANGNLLATNRPITTIYWQGTKQRKLTDEQLIVVEYLQSTLKLSMDMIQKILETEKQGKRICIAYDITFEQLSRLLEQFPTDKNITLERSFKRFYPHHTIASHIVGYLGLDIDSEGKMGLEFICDDSLKGTSGQIIRTINSVGHYLESYEVKRALAGQTIETTLNLPLQYVAEKLFPEEAYGTCIILDPQTGALEVLLSRPAFDPNIFLNPIDPKEWQQLQERACFVNRAFNACYPPASLFKLVTLSAALETNLIQEQTSWHCFGHLDFAGRAYHCKKRQGHGVLYTRQALTYSCNIPFYDIGKKIKIDTLADYAQRLGLGAKTTVLFKEKAGLTPTNQWKKDTKGEPWRPGETLSATIGQSFISVTPIQAACMVSGICQGYLVRPRILKEEPIVQKPIAIGKQTLDFLKSSMEDVIHHGTARILHRLSNFKMHAKTGTAQTSDLSKSDLGKQYLEHAWFIVYFQYKEEDPKVLAILIENTGSSAPAITMAYKFFKEYTKIMESKEMILKAA
jgi:penicillin-binding protein 2